jgi:hypothetical protein
MGQAEWLVETELLHTFVDDRITTGFDEYLYVIITFFKISERHNVQALFSTSE